MVPSAHQRPQLKHYYRTHDHDRLTDRQTTETSLIPSFNRSYLGPCSHCGMRNHKTEDCGRRPQPNRMHRTSDITGFNCNAVSDYPLLKHGGMHQTAAMQTVTYNQPHVYKTELSCGEQTAALVQLNCGCKMPTVAGAMNPEGQHKLEHWHETPCSVGRVNGELIFYFRFHLDHTKKS